MPRPPASRAEKRDGSDTGSGQFRASWHPRTGSTVRTRAHRPLFFFRHEQGSEQFHHLSLELIEHPFDGRDDVDVGDVLLTVQRLQPGFGLGHIEQHAGLVVVWHDQGWQELAVELMPGTIGAELQELEETA